jgi:(2Fe-2S) ferredoxin
MKNLEELKQIRDRARKNLQRCSGEHGVKVFVCMGTCGIAVGAKQTMNTLVDLVGKNNKTDIIITTTGCAGFCEQEPIVQVYREDQDLVLYGKVDSKVAKEIFKKHILNNQIVEKYLFKE